MLDGGVRVRCWRTAGGYSSAFTGRTGRVGKMKKTEVGLFSAAAPGAALPLYLPVIIHPKKHLVRDFSSKAGKMAFPKPVVGGYDALFPLDPGQVVSPFSPYPIQKYYFVNKIALQNPLRPVCR